MGDFKNEEILVMARDDFEMEGGGGYPFMDYGCDGCELFRIA